MVCASIAIVTGSSDSLDFETSDRLLGVSGAAACAFSFVGLVHRSWARVFFLAAAVPAALLASRPFDKGDGGDATIDLTPLFLPPVIFIFGATALFALTFSGKTEQDRTI